MDNATMEAIFKSASSTSFVAGLRAVWNAGWYEGAGKTPATTSPDKSLDAGKPAANVTPRKK